MNGINNNDCPEEKLAGAQGTCPLTYLLKNEDPLVCAEGIRTLMKKGDTAREMLVAVLHDADPTKRAPRRRHRVGQSRRHALALAHMYAPKRAFISTILSKNFF